LRAGVNHKMQSVAGLALMSKHYLDKV
jgi:hypothetical protein